LPIMRMKEIRDLTPEEKEKRIMDLRAELLRLQAMVKAGGTVDDPGRIKEIKKTLARLFTVQKEESGRGKPKGVKAL